MKPAPHASVQIQHNAATHRFEVELGGRLAVAEYRLDGGRVVFTHTFVPPELRGRGIAELLVRRALAWAKAEKLPVVPACSYVAAFIRRNPEFGPLLA